MPRSGTSSIAQFLDHLGVYFGDPARFVDATKFKHNPIFYELQWVNEFNDRVVKTLNRFKLDDDFLPLEDDFRRPQAAELGESLRKKLLDEFGDRPVVGAKDPRICFTFPLWRAVLTEMGYAIKTVLAVRSASAILKSTLAITGPRLHRWRRSFASRLLMIHYFARDVSVCQFDYDLFMREPLSYGQAKAAELGLAMSDPARATRHLSNAHYHHQPDDAGTGDPWLDEIDRDLRAGRLDSNEYLRFRGAASLFIEELEPLEINERRRSEREKAGGPASSSGASGRGADPTAERWFQEHQQLRALLQKGGRFKVKPQPDGTIDIRRISK
ncbi:MAG TPA: hypothetical protein VHX86_16370 [Tepidisphaeraceae bacterium]|jgi:hypothetical protein|nr:hypothetical protein [Tepidisphaeraceae bacterium]